MHPLITSPQNPKVKQAATLQKSRERKKQQRFLLEGLREFRYAIKSGYEVQNVFYDPEQVSDNELLEIVGSAQPLIPSAPARILSRGNSKLTGLLNFKPLSHKPVTPISCHEVINSTTRKECIS